MSLLPLIFLPAREVLYLFAFGLLCEFTWTAHRGTILMVLLIVAVWADIFLWHLNRQIRWWEHLLRVIFLRQQCVIYQALGRRRLWPEISSQQLCHVLRRFLAEAITHGEGIRLVACIVWLWLSGTSIALVGVTLFTVGQIWCWRNQHH